ncbi:hypothetical protein C2G38_2038749 [Gigaspora rosea]|uniref:Uncharacterized protein n=1 Tax=Gigaspora rosea TaxID=44941 RepID=A0A397V3M8_9GLOM|nr:hypothetical protein C2G38_2038749 [Gigaspora rosea]
MDHFIRTENELKAHASRPKISLLQHHKKDDNIGSYSRGKSRGIETGDEIPIEGCKTLNATCATWKTKVELFKTQRNATECRKDLLDQTKSSCEDLDVAYRMWMAKVENIRDVELVKEEEKPILNVPPCKVEDNIPDTNVEPEWYGKGHEGNKIANEIAIRSRIKRWINRCKAAKPLKYKKNRRKYIPNGFGEIQNDHVIYEFRAGIDSGKIPMMLLVERLFIYNNLGDRGKWMTVKKKKKKKKKKLKIVLKLFQQINP